MSLLTDDDIEACLFKADPTAEFQPIDKLFALAVEAKARSDLLQALSTLEALEKPVLYGFQYKTGPIVEAEYTDRDLAHAAWKECIPDYGNIVELYTIPRTASAVVMVEHLCEAYHQQKLKEGLLNKEAKTLDGYLCRTRTYQGVPLVEFVNNLSDVTNFLTCHWWGPEDTKEAEDVTRELENFNWALESVWRRLRLRGTVSVERVTPYTHDQVRNKK